ncbi:MAG TPA: hypothetical protein VJX74_07140, partial [Blastocatellia bacterium]|nr:hypothetical protein [Blastocatellia bacterium]
MMNTENNHRARAGSMRRSAAARRNALRATLTALVLLLCYTQIRSTAAQGAITGEWIIESKPGTDQVYLTVQHGNGRHNHSMSSTDIKQENLKGLNPALMQGNGSPVQFQIVREAGTLNCEGWFKQGKGSGHFTFASNAAFVSELRKRNYGAPTEAQLF